MPVVGSRADLLLVLIGDNHHLDVCIKIELDAFSRCRDCANSLLGLINATLSHQPPWRFWCKEGSRDDGNGPDPLESERNAVTPLSGVLHQTSEDTGGQETANDPAHVDPRSHVSSEMHRAEIRSIRDRKCLEDTPWKTLDNTSDKEHLQSCREERDEDGSSHEQHAGNHGLLVSNPFSDVSVDDETENASDLCVCQSSFRRLLHQQSAYLCSIEDDSLPPRRHKLVAICIDFIAESVAEGLEGEEFVHETGIVSLHHNAKRNDERKDDGLPPEPQGLSDGHVMLIVDSRVGVVSGVVCLCRGDPFGGHMASSLLY